MSASSPSSPVDSHPDSMRVMVAAVVAQQAMLDERDATLKQREQSISEQERQLGERLADKHRQLEHLHEQLADAREQFRRERADQCAKLDEAAKIHAEALAEREQLRELRLKFLKRWKRHWSAEDRSRQEKDTEIAAKSAAVQHELDAASDIRLRLEAEAQQIQTDRARWYQDTSNKAASLTAMRDSLLEKQRIIADSERRLHDEKSRLEHECESLRAEARGLEKRIGHARRMLIAEEIQHNPPALPAADAIPLSPLAVELPQPIEEALAAREDYHKRCQAALQRQAATLADQRMHLAEMCERLVQAESDWQAKQIEAVAEMERLASDLQQREDALAERTRQTEAEAQRSRQEREQLAGWHSDLQRAAAELALRQSAQRGEWDRLRAQLVQRERLAERREQAMNELLARWRKRRQAESDRLRQLVQAAIEAREEFVQSRIECHDRARSLNESQQALAEQVLAFEEVRREFLAETDRPKTAARRLEIQRRRWSRRNAAAQHELNRLRETLAAEDAELRQIYHELHGEQAAVIVREQDLAQQLTELENERRRAAEITRQFESARTAWREQRRAYELQLTDLWAEIDRLKLAGGSPQRSAA